MAILKEITTDAGIIARYWRIAQMRVQFFNPLQQKTSRTTIIVHGYATEQHRLDQKKNATSYTIDSELTFSSLAEAYEFLKTNDDFAGGQDI